MPWSMLILIISDKKGGYMVEEYLEELKNGNDLNDCVLDYYIDRKYSNPDELIRDMEDLQRYGCVSGMITDLIYYDDTNKFYDNYKDDINELLSDLLDGSGLSIQEFFGKNFDNDDPLILNFSNKNLLAWFGFEESSYRIYEEIKEKMKYNDFNYEC